VPCQDGNPFDLSYSDFPGRLLRGAPAKTRAVVTESCSIALLAVHEDGRRRPYRSMYIEGSLY
jgi:hypothetical protein